MAARPATTQGSGRPLALLLDSAYPEHSLERAIIEAAGGRLLVNLIPHPNEQQLLELDALREAQVLLVELADVSDRVLAAAPNCRAVIRYGTGTDNVDTHAAEHRGIAVHGIPGYAADSVADHALALVLALLRMLPQATSVVAAGGWRGDPGIERPIGLRGLTLGLVGAGAIARAVATRARAFGMQCIAFDPLVTEAGPTGIDLLPLDEVLARSDIVSLHAPLTRESRGLIGAAALAKMRRGAYLVNTARGGLIDEDSLRRALDSGQLRGAGLDVTTPEPLAPDSWLRSDPRVILTPHIGFWSDQSELALRTAVAHLATQVMNQ